MTKSRGIGKGSPGITRSLEFRAYMSSIRVGYKNPNWSGDKVTYKSLHQWVRRNSNIPKNCEHCKSESRLDAANISGEYKRDLSDWKFLCRKCHMDSDGRLAAWQERNHLRRNGMINHYRCLIDVSTEPFYCSEHEIYLNSDGTELKQVQLNDNGEEKEES